MKLRYIRFPYTYSTCETNQLIAYFSSCICNLLFDIRYTKLFTSMHTCIPVKGEDLLDKKSRGTLTFLSGEP